MDQETTFLDRQNELARQSSSNSVAEGGPQQMAMTTRPGVTATYKNAPTAVTATYNQIPAGVTATYN